MQIIATQKNIRQPARKLRLVARAVSSLSLEAALRQLAVIERRSAEPIMKVVRQAIADAAHNHSITPAQLTLKTITINEGPTYKRFRSVSRGRAHKILKRSAHVTVILEGVSPVEQLTSQSKEAKKIDKSVKKSDAKETQAVPSPISKSAIATPVKDLTKISAKTSNKRVSSPKNSPSRQKKV